MTTTHRKPMTQRTTGELLRAWERAETLTADEMATLIAAEPGVARAAEQDAEDEAKHQAFLNQ
ncbi:hypothetical protein H6F86_21025 [Phormidium sp. FACHB-592]|uniref:Uncharacterized protein n=1 Tax=Stenomitos frigidus AS-A4 TaxID=2933935 RepID=A0ABV0KF55_9CYAN|nr:hypothetical protein [Phormidium sp. FACHB-592]MBD2076318.1 hypothetical protein [Phormidium sp. FACHB-592]